MFRFVFCSLLKRSFVFVLLMCALFRLLAYVILGWVKMILFWCSFLFDVSFVLCRLFVRLFSLFCLVMFDHLLCVLSPTFIQTKYNHVALCDKLSRSAS